jgi:hypothetical protein
MLEREITLAEIHASLADHRERMFRSRSEIWELVAGSRQAIVHSQQLMAEAEATLSPGRGRPPAKPELREQVDFTQEANACFRLAERESHAGLRTMLMGMGHGWLVLAHRDRQR